MKKEKNVIVHAKLIPLTPEQREKLGLTGKVTIIKMKKAYITSFAELKFKIIFPDTSEEK